MRKIATVLAVSLLAFGSSSVNAQAVSPEQYQQMLQQMYGGGNPMDNQIKQPKQLVVTWALMQQQTRWKC